MTPHSVVDRLQRLKAEEPGPTYSELVGEDLSDLEVAELWLVLDAYATAAKQAAQMIGGEWVQRYAETGAVEVYGLLVYATDSTKWERCTDPDGFWKAAKRYGFAQVSRWFNPNEAKMGSLPQAIRDTFFEKGRNKKPEASPASIPLEMLT